MNLHSSAKEEEAGDHGKFQAFMLRSCRKTNKMKRTNSSPLPEHWLPPGSRSTGVGKGKNPDLGLKLACSRTLNVHEEVTTGPCATGCWNEG